jgi:2-polyprenyl-3-methyl-5-hydroxy-6-metoxy-1,4-benzoquinol methylase
MAEPSPKPIIDVEELVADLKRRVERERAEGAYEDDLSQIELEKPPPAGDPTTPSMMQGFDLGAAGPRVRFRPELGFSSKPVIGPVITLFKRFFLRLLFHVFDDLARQTDAAIARVEAALAVDVAGRERLEASTRAELRAESAAREWVQADVKALSERIAALGSRLEHLQLESRLARLERARKTAAIPQPAVQSEGLPAGQAAAAPLFDYETFEARFRPEASVREHQQAYVELLLGKKRVVDLGCGRGELIEMLQEKGVSAYGVEIDPDFISLLEEKGIEVVAQDAVAHLSGLEPEAVDGVVASHVVEHLPAAAVSMLVALAAEKLAPDGILILETPNPESLVAGSVNFHRDLTHVRPIHPDTLAFLCESAGFAQVEIRRLSPMPDDELLPATGDARLDPVVERLNELLYGYQDYAVVARRSRG